VTSALLEDIVTALPPEWLGDDDPQLYVDYLLGRIAEPRPWVDEAEAARER